jgi:branched-subunit amino acid aminotransferase/4-amino-4-deoxychorismate lyase
MKTIYLDGQYLQVDTKIMDAFTPGILKAKGVFETMLGVDGFVMDTALHIKRLQEGLKVLKIKPPVIKPLILRQVLERNQLSLARVRLMVWQDGKETHVMVSAFPYQGKTKKSRVCLIKTDRAANARLANVKSLDYAVFAGAFAKAQAQGFDEALLLNRRGHIFEASRGNIFWIKDKILYTPPLSSGCLNGITRQQVIKQAIALRIPMKEKNLDAATFKKADAVFLTNSLAGIKPIEVTSIRQV